MPCVRAACVCVRLCARAAPGPFRAQDQGAVAPQPRDAHLQDVAVGGQRHRRRGRHGHQRRVDVPPGMCVQLARGEDVRRGRHDVLPPHAGVARAVPSVAQGRRDCLTKSSIAGLRARAPVLQRPATRLACAAALVRVLHALSPVRHRLSAERWPRKHGWRAHGVDLTARVFSAHVFLCAPALGRRKGARQGRQTPRVIDVSARQTIDYTRRRCPSPRGTATCRGTTPWGLGG